MTVNCKACGATDVVPNSVFCHRCGARIESDGSSPSGSMRGILTPPAGSQSIVDQPREPREKTPPSASQQPPGGSGAGPVVSASKGRDQEPERDIWTVQFSPRGMIGSWIVVGAVVAAGLSMPVFFPSIGWTWALLACFLVVLGQQCRYWYWRFGLKYRLTSYRLLEESGIISRTVNRVELIEIEDIQLVRTLIDRLVGIGSIKILSRDLSHPQMQIDAIEEVENRFDELEQAMRIEKRRRELHIPQG